MLDVDDNLAGQNEDRVGFHHSNIIQAVQAEHAVMQRIFVKLLCDAAQQNGLAGIFSRGFVHLLDKRMNPLAAVIKTKDHALPDRNRESQVNRQ